MWFYIDIRDFNMYNVKVVDRKKRLYVVNFRILN